MVYFDMAFVTKIRFRFAQVSDSFQNTPLLRIPTATLCFGISVFLSLLATYELGVQGDYISYINQWLLVLNHQDPWSTNNAYGPLHNVFAYIMRYFGILGPKIFFTLSWDLFLISCWLSIRDKSARKNALNLLFYLGVGNFLILPMVFIYGSNDVLVAALVGSALLCMLSERRIAGGILLGLAALVKFYPILCFPSLLLSKSKQAFITVLVASLTFAVGMGLSFIVWGRATLHPIFFGISREGNLLSIFSFIKFINTPDKFLLNFMIEANAIFVIATVFVCSSLGYLNGLSSISSLAISFPLILLIYKEGNPQYYVCWLAILCVLLVRREADYETILRRSFIFILFLSLFELGYFFSGTNRYTEGWGLIIRNYIGLLSFFLGLALFLPLIRKNRFKQDK